MEAALELRARALLALRRYRRSPRCFATTSPAAPAKTPPRPRPRQLRWVLISGVFARSSRGTLFLIWRRTVRTGQIKGTSSPPVPTGRLVWAGDPSDHRPASHRRARAHGRLPCRRTPEKLN